MLQTILKENIIFILFLYLTFISCQKFDNQLKSDNRISDKIEQKFTSQKNIIDFKILDEFEWDQLMILGPYADLDHIGRLWRLDLSNIERHIIKSADDIHLILFFKDNSLTKIAEISRRIGDFQNLEILIPKSRAKFYKEAKEIMLVNDSLNKYSFYRDITVFTKFNDFKKIRGLLLNHQKNSNSFKALQYIRYDSLHLLILEKTIKINEWQVAYELLDTVKLVNKNAQLKVGFGDCKDIHNNKDEIIFAFSIINDSAFFEIQLKSWKIDLQNNKFIKLQNADIKCINEEYHNNP